MRNFGGGIITPPTFDPVSAFNTAFDEELSPYPDKNFRISGKASKAHPHGEDEDWWRVEGPLMLQRWVDWRERTPWEIWVTPDGRPAIELELVVKVDGQLVKLIIDRVFATDEDNTRPVPVDLKSGKPPVGLLQLGIYKVGIEQQWPQVKVAGGAFWQARSGEMSGIHPLGQFTPALVGAYMRRLKMIRAAGAYIPHVSPSCRTCDVGSYCAVNDGALAPGNDPDYELMGK